MEDRKRRRTIGYYFVIITCIALILSVIGFATPCWYKAIDGTVITGLFHTCLFTSELNQCSPNESHFQPSVAASIAFHVMGISVELLTIIGYLYSASKYTDLTQTWLTILNPVAGILLLIPVVSMHVEFITNTSTMVICYSMILTLTAALLLIVFGVGAYIWKKTTADDNKRNGFLRNQSNPQGNRYTKADNFLEPTSKMIKSPYVTGVSPYVTSAQPNMRETSQYMTGQPPHGPLSNIVESPPESYQQRIFRVKMPDYVRKQSASGDEQTSYGYEQKVYRIETPAYIIDDPTFRMEQKTYRIEAGQESHQHQLTPNEYQQKSYKYKFKDDIQPYDNYKGTNTQGNETILKATYLGTTARNSDGMKRF